MNKGETRGGQEEKQSSLPPNHAGEGRARPPKEAKAQFLAAGEAPKQATPPHFGEEIFLTVSFQCKSVRKKEAGRERQGK